MNKNQVKTIRAKKMEYKKEFEKFKEEAMKNEDLMKQHEKKMKFFLEQMAKSQIQFKTLDQLEKDIK